jgi:hypothetical protein
MVRLLALLLLLLACSLPAGAQMGEPAGSPASVGAALPRRPLPRETLFITAARVLPASGDPLLLGRIVVRDGKITAVGTEIPRPAYSREIDASSLTVTPGFVVPLSRL